MRYQELFENEDEMKNTLGNYFHIFSGFTINSDNTVDIRGNCRLIKNTKKLPIKFGRIEGTFDCFENKLVSLSGAPDYVGGTFNCNDNQLTSLVGAPSYVGRDFACNDNKLLISLEGFPKKLKGIFACDWTKDLPLLRTLQAEGGVEIYHARIAGRRITDIINRYVGHTNLRHAILDCQRDLIAAGYEGNARW